MQSTQSFRTLPIENNTTVQKLKLKSENMLLRIVQFVCLFLILSEVSGLPECGEFEKGQAFIQSNKLPFQNEFGELLRNFNESEPGQIERISQILHTINIRPFVSNFDGVTDLKNANENRVNFVVSPENA